MRAAQEEHESRLERLAGVLAELYEMAVCIAERLP
jgi:hypothetical protein